MKNLGILYLIILSCPLYAQYSGGSGKGDANSLFRGTADGPQYAAQVVFTTQPPSTVAPGQTFNIAVEIRDIRGRIAVFSTEANGSGALTIGNNPGSATLSGSSPVNFVDGVGSFSGMSINNHGVGYTLDATIGSVAGTSSAFDVFSLYTGGSGKGDASQVTTPSTLTGEIFWVGTIDTDWAKASNWRPNRAVPGPLDHIGIEPNGNGRNLVLDKNRSITYLNFYGADKLVELGNFNLTILHSSIPLISAAGHLVGTNSLNYFKTNGTGRLRRFINGFGFDFPVGNSAFNPCYIGGGSSALLVDTFAVRVLDEVYEYGTFGNVVTEPRVKRTWDINKERVPNPNPNPGILLTFHWNAGEETSPGPNDYELFHHDANGNGWEQVVVGTHLKSGRMFTYYDYQGGFSPFAIGDQNQPLPVVLLYFTGNCSPEGMDFKWATASEVNSQSFTLEHSANLSDWFPLQTQPAAGFSSSEKTYSAQLPSSQNVGPYFRLHQQDFDGKFERFAPLFLECGENKGEGLMLFPNPSQGQVKVSGFSGTLDWQINDASGRCLRSGQFNSNAGQELLPTDGLPAGLYFFNSSKGRLPLMLQN